MAVTECCGNPQLRWTQSRVGERWSDINVCASCHHIHAMESCLAPIQWPAAEGCVNCGGGYIGSASAKAAPRCERCGLTAQKDRDLHDVLVSAHPEKNFAKGAEVASALGRHVLALKLATAATRWGSPEDAVIGRRIRIESLYRIGQVDRALDEAYEWANHGGAPPSVWSQIATMEGETGNVEATVQALKYGVQVDPTNADMWANYAEILLMQGNLPRALDAARHVLVYPDYVERALAVIAEAAEASYADGRPHDAKLAANVAGDRLESTEALTWLLARMSAGENDEDQAVAWLQKTLKLNPEHAEAQAALLALRPPAEPKKAGWRPW